MESHGADIYTASKKSGIKENEIIDFSSNINPLGIPEKVERAAINSIKYTNRYPDINSRELIKSISACENVLRNGFSLQMAQRKQYLELLYI